MNAKPAEHIRLRLCTILDENIMLWSDDYLEEQRQESFVRWCFDTGDPKDLEQFHRLEAELEMRREAAELRKEWAAAIKEDPVWRVRATMRNGTKPETAGRTYRSR